MRPTLAVVAALAATALLGPAAAQTDEEPVRLEYHAPANCEDDAQFFARARSRAPRMRTARPDERARSFVVEIEQRAGRTSARLTVRNAEGRQTVRDIEAKDCAEAVDALALIVALAVNPRAAQGGPPVTSGEPEPASSAAPGATSAPSASSVRASPNAPAPSDVPSTIAPPSALTSTESSRDAQRWAFRAGLAAWGVGAMAPEPLLGARASAEMLNVAEQVIAPSYRASLGVATHEGFVVDGGTAHFTYAGTNFEICPLRIPPGGPLALRPCVVADVGVLFSRGTDALNPKGAARPWADLGAGGRLEWMLGRRLTMDLDVACMFPVWRDRFLFGSRSFHRVAWAGGVVALGFVMRIP